MIRPRRAPAAAAPRLEKDIQSLIIALLRTIPGTDVYSLGRPAARGDVHKGTRQTPGMCDVLAFLPEAPRPRTTDGLRTAAHALAIEAKRPGNKRSRDQDRFRFSALRCGLGHVTGGLDDVLAYLELQGYIRLGDVAHYRHDAIRAAQAAQAAEESTP